MKIFAPFFATTVASALVAASLSSSNVRAYTPTTSNNELGRREMLRTFVGSSVTAAAFLTTVGVNPSAADAMEACKKGSKNCIRTTWTPPAGTSASDAASTLERIIKSYPQEGVQKIDAGGWTVVDDVFGPGKTASLEYKSGIGNFAKFFNGGKPFVDDLKLEIGSDGVVEVRSSSRVGDSDLGVNQMRLVRFRILRIDFCLATQGCVACLSFYKRSTLAESSTWCSKIERRPELR